ncbi:MAG: tRNA 2-thiocytidine(32) synthetase TtcA [Deltaproteobacteria bacterium]|jgi:tRNA 2-thiocytidine biosynthesis protein TtcA|nr:tRNA 2-thiocytidine(32) synthetase TtcA [Deltaproteobacteria bacterium]
MEKPARSKLFLHLKKWLEKAVMEYGMIAEGDRVLVGVSGGKDSMVLLDLLATPMLFVPSFSLAAVHIDMGFDPAYGCHDALKTHFEERGCDYTIEKSDIGPLAQSDYNRKNPCFLCSRLRRKRIFEIAAEKGCNKIALAHHRDDIVETLLINLFYGREISTMMPVQSVFGGKMHIIRPLSFLREGVIKKYAAERGLPVFQNLCPSNDDSKRLYVKNLLNGMEKDNRKVRDNILRAMTHVKMDYLPKKYVKAAK